MSMERFKDKFDAVRVFNDLHKFGDFLADHPELKVEKVASKGPLIHAVAKHPVRGVVASIWAYSV
jgi:hypothetical protein